MEATTHDITSKKKVTRRERLKNGTRSTWEKNRWYVKPVLQFGLVAAASAYGTGFALKNQPLNRHLSKAIELAMDQQYRFVDSIRIGKHEGMLDFFTDPAEADISMSIQQQLVSANDVLEGNW